MHLSASSVPIISAGTFYRSDIAFVADPFRVAFANMTYVFAEVWSRSAQRGQIAVFTLNEQMQVADSAIVLSESFHLSYPCVFRLADAYYMLPEAWESQQLILYKARRFPWSWDRFSTLLELDYADPQIFFYKGIWYIFLNTDPLSNAQLSLFWAESLLDKWHEHPQNARITQDRRRARSAGSLILHRGRIFRFTQDCRERYGSGVFASEIVDLSPSSFRTIPVGPLVLNRPEWARDAFHHVDVFLEGGVHYALFDGYTIRDPPLQ
jgi:hypothetical protein